MWIALVTSLPTENATSRQRVWRSLRHSGAAVLRDGVYLMPERPSCLAVLEAVAADVRRSGGTAFVLRVDEPAAEAFHTFFDRSRDYAALQAEIAAVHAGLTVATLPNSMRLVRRLRKHFSGLVELDFFPADAQRLAGTALQALEAAAARVLAPDEPQATAGAVQHRTTAQFHGRVWATRQRPWVDRLASAWLILRFIDPDARFLWLERPADCPPGAVGFDFDRATFTHVGDKVTFEVLLASFSLERAGLARIGQLVHYLDVGGTQPVEAVGVETVLAGMRSAITDDEALLAAAAHVFDGLLASFSVEGSR